MGTAPGRSSRHPTAMRNKHRGTLTKKISRQFQRLARAAPYIGPRTPPASAEPPMMPRIRARRRCGNMSADAAIAMGTSAPPPADWTTRAATNRSRRVRKTQKALPSMNSASATTYMGLLPHTSARRPNNGMAIV